MWCHVGGGGKKEGRRGRERSWTLTLISVMNDIGRSLISGSVISDYIRIVPDRRSRDHEVVVVRRTINLGTGNLEWGGNGEG